MRCRWPHNNRPCNVPVKFSDLGINHLSYKLWCYLIEFSLAPATVDWYQIREFAIHQYGKRQGTLKSDSEWRGKWRMPRRLLNGELRMVWKASGDIEKRQRIANGVANGERRTVF